MKEEIFLSCDWGTSNFRLRAIQLPSLNVLGEELSDDGILKTNDLWADEGIDERLREDFFFSIVERHVKALSAKMLTDLEQYPLIFSGMASSNIGIRPLKYKSLPFLANGSDLVSHPFSWRQLKGVMISGAATNEDVMRGEETQLIGAFNSIKAEEGAHYFILPGTHAKHIMVKEQQVIAFKTFMTGELFDLLCKNSILKNAVCRPKSNKIANHHFFERGIRHSLGKNVLNGLFHVRAFDLFREHGKEENYHFLSGLLIGAELQALREGPADMQYHLVAANLLCQYYAVALDVLNIPYTHHDSERALIIGQHQIYLNCFQ